VRQIILAVPMIAVVCALSVPAIADWRLMGRHGGCESLSDAAKRKSEFDGVSGPRDFAAKMRRSGERVNITDQATATGRVVTVEVPGRGLSLIFVGSEVCAKR
jgi:hypothetical protein